MELVPNSYPNKLHTWQIPTISGVAEVTATAGQATVILGANGAGKSGLATWMVTQFPSGKKIERLLAHRQVWLSSSATDLTPTSRLENEAYWLSQDRRDESRWKDVVGQQRNSILLLDLATAENYHNANIVAALKSNSNWQTLGEGPFVKLNRILERAGLDVKISMSQIGELSTTNRDGASYQIAMMSDGEKSGLILAGKILTADKNAVVLLDAPERHLHRAVSARLVASALQERPDCSFVIFTHDIELANDLRSAGSPVLVVKSSTWANGKIKQWDMQEVPVNNEIPDGVIQAVMGARRKVLFCEGIHGGLDHRLYTLLYPDWHVIPVGSCGDVIRTTKGLKSLEGFAWVESRGVVDADRRTDSEAMSLAMQGVWVNSAHEIENLLFLPVCQHKVADQQAYALGLNSTELVSESHSKSVEAL